VAAPTPAAVTASPHDIERVTELLGRPPQGDFEVVVRSGSGNPVVLANAPLLHDGTPMPTMFWLADPALRAVIGTLESEGGVGRAEAEVDPGELAALHRAHARERDAIVGASHEGPRPSGGVGGTRQGVKCLHAHYAHWLAGAEDPVGEWVQAQLVTGGLLPPGAPARIIP